MTPTPFLKTVILTILLLMVLGPTTIAEEQLSIFVSPEKGKAPLEVNFAIKASIPVEGYAWDFTSDGTIDSTDPTPSYTYEQEGEYVVTFKTTIEGEESVLTTKVKVTNEEQLKVSVAVNPAEGVAPLTVQFTAAAIGKEPLTYEWDFNQDGKADSFSQTPTTTLSKAGEYNIQLIVSDKEGEAVKKNIHVTVSPYDSSLALRSYFPTNLTVGENTITFIIINEGNEQIENIKAKIVGTNIQQISSTAISTLEQGNEDSLTIKVNILQEGALNATIKVMDKSFPLQLSVVKPIAYSDKELQAELQQLKEKFDRQEKKYYEKKEQGYLVGEFSDAMKNIQQELQEAQLQILTEKGEEAKVTMNLASIAITDFQEDLALVKKQKVTPLLWMKENALAITAIIAAFGTLSGILLKLKHHAIKVTGKVAGKAKELVRSEGKEEKKKKQQTETGEKKTRMVTKSSEKKPGKTTITPTTTPKEKEKQEDKKEKKNSEGQKEKTE